MHPTTDRLALLPLTGAGDVLCELCQTVQCPFSSLHGNEWDRRTQACIQAERDAARMRAVEVAARAVMTTREALASPETVVDDDFVERAESEWAALRAALKETP